MHGFSRGIVRLFARARDDNSEKLGYSSESRVYDCTGVGIDSLVVQCKSTLYAGCYYSTRQHTSCWAGHQDYDVPRLAQYNAACRQALAAVPGFTMQCLNTEILAVA